MDISKQMHKHMLWSQQSNMQPDLRMHTCEHIISVLQLQKDVNQKQRICVEYDIVLRDFGHEFVAGVWRVRVLMSMKASYLEGADVRCPGSNVLPLGWFQSTIESSQAMASSEFFFFVEISISKKSFDENENRKLCVGIGPFPCEQRTKPTAWVKK
ncbi:hypothetical protein TNCV_1040521 [Trichonephila clavipes]|nr:hypothetical protein TNCV_1040521 [Trichonephila clavipes]